MRVRRLVLCMFLSLAMIVTFIPICTFGYTQDVEHGTIVIDGWNPDEGGLIWTDPITEAKAELSCDNGFAENGCIADAGDTVYINISDVPEGMYVAGITSSGGDVDDGDEPNSYSFTVAADEEDIGNIITIDIQSDPTIDECGTVVVAGDDWELVPDTHGTEWKTEEGAHISLNGKIWGFEEEDDYAHFKIGDKVGISVSPPGDKWVGSLKVNEVECNADSHWQYSFDAIADTENGPGNIITVDFAEIFAFDALDETAKTLAEANPLGVGQEKTADTSEGDAFFLFEPEKDGIYIFYSDAGDYDEPDPIGRVLDEDGGVIEVSDDNDFTGTLDFAVFFYAEAGHKYYLQAKAYYDNVTFSVRLTKDNVTKIEFVPTVTTIYSEDIKSTEEEFLDLSRRAKHSAGNETWYSCFAVGDKLIVYYDDAPAETYINKDFSYTEPDENGTEYDCWEDAFFCGDKMIYPNMWNDKDIDHYGDALAAGKNTVTVEYRNHTTTFNLTVETPQSRAEAAARKAQAEAAAAAAAVEAARQGTYNASMPAVKASKPKAAKKAITVKWKKLKKKQLKSGVSNIEVWVCSDGAFARGATIEKIVGKKKASVKIKGLQKGVTYYAKVRTIKYVNGVKVVGNWSKVKKVKVKK